MIEPNLGMAFLDLGKEPTRSRNPEPLQSPLAADCMKGANNLGLVTRIVPRDYEEPTNEELGIEPYTGWRLVAIWLALMIGSFGVVFLVGYGLLEMLK